MLHRVTKVRIDSGVNIANYECAGARRLSHVQSTYSGVLKAELDCDESDDNGAGEAWDRFGRIHNRKRG